LKKAMFALSASPYRRGTDARLSSEPKRVPSP
jgi:gamma-glutamyl:cysteine ligase YbdK (ATP-grasp superfamily)